MLLQNCLLYTAVFTVSQLTCGIWCNFDWNPEGQGWVICWWTLSQRWSYFLAEVHFRKTLLWSRLSAVCVHGYYVSRVCQWANQASSIEKQSRRRYFGCPGEAKVPCSFFFIKKQKQLQQCIHLPSTNMQCFQQQHGLPKVSVQAQWYQTWQPHCENFEKWLHLAVGWQKNSSSTKLHLKPQTYISIYVQIKQTR